MKYQIEHTTAYTYSSPASLSQNELILFPRETASQQVVTTQLEVAPAPQHLISYSDYFGNTVHHFMVQHSHDDLSISSRSTVTTENPVLPAARETPPWEGVVARLQSARQCMGDLWALQFYYASPFVPQGAAMREYALRSFPSGMPVLQGALDLMKRIYTEFAYDKRASTVDTTVEQVLQEKKGVCQDFAHLAISCLRSLGLSARYVSGYLETKPPPGKAKLIGADASHAWFSIYIPEFGWVDLDPTNNLAANETYITVAWGRDYGDVAPVKGVVLGGGSHVLSVAVTVTRLV